MPRQLARLPKLNSYDYGRVHQQNQFLLQDQNIVAAPNPEQRQLLYLFHRKSRFLGCQFLDPRLTYHKHLHNYPLVFDLR